MSNNAQRTLQEVLTEYHLVTEEELTECEAIDKVDVGRGLPDILLDRRYVHEGDLVSAFSESLGIEEIDLADYAVPKEVLDLIPENIVETYRVLPIELDDGTLTVAVFDPTRLPALDAVAKATGCRIRPLVATRSVLLKSIQDFYGQDESDLDDDIMEEIVEPADDSEIDEVPYDDTQEHVNVDAAGAEEKPVIRIVRRILRDAFKVSASDIHVEPFEKFISLRYRIDGTLEDFKRPPKAYQANIIARLKILSGCRLDEHRIPQDGRITVHYEGRRIDLRVAFLPCKHGEKVVLRILDQTSLALSFESLGFEPQPMKDFQRALTAPNGMVLVTGPTGSGKTTTLYSALSDLNTRKVNIVTVENPIEYELVGINQVQTKSSIGLTFASALRQILRQDPDIVMVGEVRDAETAAVAVKAALTGHLVLSTLHTNDAAGVYPRLIDMGVEPFLVESSVLLSSAQRLLKRVCTDCAEEIKIDAETLDRSQLNLDEYPSPPKFLAGRGCKTCRETGYRGRLAVIEVMMNGPELSALAAEKASAQRIKKTAIELGMKTLRQNALAKASRGLTTMSEVLLHTYDD
jgi:type IV pilus assembly protein PilB